jgi:DNA-directed RNA polymerase specialized sigma24 family protein
MVLAVCRNVLRAQHDVEHAFEDTFLALARRAHTIKHSETIGPWLDRVARRLAQKARFEAPQMKKVVSVRPMRAIASIEAVSAVRIQPR